MWSHKWHLKYPSPGISDLNGKQRIIRRFAQETCNHISSILRIKLLLRYEAQRELLFRATEKVCDSAQRGCSKTVAQSIWKMPKSGASLGGGLSGAHPPGPISSGGPLSFNDMCEKVRVSESSNAKLQSYKKYTRTLKYRTNHFSVDALNCP